MNKPHCADCNTTVNFVEYSKIFKRYLCDDCYTKACKPEVELRARANEIKYRRD